MMKIEFKTIKLSEDENTVFIKGYYKDKEIEIKMSILQLAKLWGTDRKITEELDRDFGSEELEYQCDETRELVSKFPNIKEENNELDFDCYSIVGSTLDRDNPERKFVTIFVEDIVGWDNEGIIIKFPTELYNSTFEGKRYQTNVETIEKKVKVTSRFIEVEEEN